MRRNPLMRPADRVRSSVDVLAAVLMAAVVPVAGAIGTVEYGHAVAAVRAADTEKSPVEATVVGLPQLRNTLDRFDRLGQQYRAEVQWPQDGRLTQATVDVPARAVPSDTVTVWLGADGHPTTPPVPTSAAGYQGAAAGAGVLLGAWLVLLCADWSIRRLIDLREGRAWSQEWLTINGPIEQDR
jgi:hypothetical protein